MSAKLIRLKRPKANRAMRLLSEASNTAKDMKACIVIAGMKNGDWHVWQSEEMKCVEVAMADMSMKAHVAKWLDDNE